MKVKEIDIGVLSWVESGIGVLSGKDCVGEIGLF